MATLNMLMHKVEDFEEVHMQSFMLSVAKVLNHVWM